MATVQCFLIPTYYVQMMLFIDKQSQSCTNWKYACSFKFLYVC